MAVDLRLLGARVAAGDAAAFRAIVEHTQGRLYRLAARMLGRLGDGEDALQEAYLKAFRALRGGQYDGRAALETWLVRIVVNACTDRLRRRREQPAERAPEPRFDGAITAEARQSLRELDRWLAELPPTQRAVLVLSAIEGLSAAEIAELVGSNENAVMQRLVRARATLRARREATEREATEGAGDERTE